MKFDIETFRRPVLAFVGRLGDPARCGLLSSEFARRQAMYRAAEIAAMHDVPAFADKARDIYGYPHFVNDVGGSLCELDEPAVIDLLVGHTLILYIEVTTPAEEDELIRRAHADPKPLYFPPRLSRRGIAPVSCRTRPARHRRYGPRRLFALDLSAPVPLADSALPSDSRPAWLHRDLGPSGPCPR